MAKKNENRCWPGYEPVPGKPRRSQGSCRPKADSKLTPAESEFRASRKEQLDTWKKKHPGSSKAAAQHLHPPEAETKTARSRKTATKKASSKTRKVTEKTGASKTKMGARKTATAKKAAAKARSKRTPPKR